MGESLPFLAFNIARIFAFIALVPGCWMLWMGLRQQYRRLWSAVGVSFAILVSICLFAALSSGGSHADGWDVLGTVFWSTVAGAVLIVCAVVGAVVGKLRGRAAVDELSE